MIMLNGRLAGPPTSSGRKPRFAVGQVVRHKRYGYRGVIVGYDPCCKAEDDWYYANPTQPTRDQPWYHVLVHGTPRTTYPAESSLVADTSEEPVVHPMLDYFFSGWENGRYVRNDTPWPG
jgi:heat shock protein HspQ